MSSSWSSDLILRKTDTHKKKSEDQLDINKKELSYKHLIYRINRRNLSLNQKFMISILTK